MITFVAHSGVISRLCFGIAARVSRLIPRCAITSSSGIFDTHSEGERSIKRSALKHLQDEIAVANVYDIRLEPFLTSEA